MFSHLTVLILSDSNPGLSKPGYPAHPVLPQTTLTENYKEYILQ